MEHEEENSMSKAVSTQLYAASPTHSLQQEASFESQNDADSPSRSQRYEAEEGTDDSSFSSEKVTDIIASASDDDYSKSSPSSKVLAIAVTSLYLQEAGKRLELADVLTEKMEDLEKLKHDRDEIECQLRNALDQTAKLKQRIADSDLSMNELKEKFISAVELLKRYRNEIDYLRAENTRASEVNTSLSTTLSIISQSQTLTEFSSSDIVEATSSFDPSLKLGEGSHGVIYKGFLFCSRVAIRMLQPDKPQSPSEFLLLQVEFQGKIRHPNVVALIGVCRETEALIYEYLSNGSLEDRLNCKGDSPPLSWKTRIRIAVELCSVLMFLHSNRKHGVVHGNLKPSNILLDRNFVSKLSDFGVCDWKYGQPRTDPYIDPEFQLSGEFSPKSDIYSFGVILLKLLTARASLGLAKNVQRALDTNNLNTVLDYSAGQWPFTLAWLLASLALRCCEEKPVNRPVLNSEVWTALESMMSFCGESPCFQIGSTDLLKPPSCFVCPIFQEVMKDPHVAADGFTYEAEALKGWFDHGKKTSPMTNLELPHLNIVPNHSLRSAIQEWQQSLNNKS